MVCLWESPSLTSLQEYVDATIGDASINTLFEVAAEPAFSERPLGLATQPIARRPQATPR